MTVKNATVYVDAYEVPDNSLFNLLRLKRMGLLHRAFFVGSMYQDTKRTLMESAKWHFSSWLDALDAEALAQVDAVETLSVEYEVWTHLYDLAVAPPHLQYTSFEGCVPLAERPLASDNQSMSISNQFVCKGEWLLCPTPHSNYFSILFTEGHTSKSQGAFHQISHRLSFSDLAERMKSSSVYASKSTLNGTYMMLLSGTVVLSTANGSKKNIRCKLELRYTDTNGNKE